MAINTSPNVAFYGKLEISEMEGIAHETPQKAGGWGYPHGNERSGAWLGLEAARLTLHWLDGRDEPLPLLESAYAHFDNDLMRLVIWAKFVEPWLGDSLRSRLAPCESDPVSGALLMIRKAVRDQALAETRSK